MNVEHLSVLWSRQTVIGIAPSSAHLMRQLAAENRRRESSLRRVVVLAATICILGWILVPFFHFTGIKPLNAVSLGTFGLTAAVEFGFLVWAWRALQGLRAEAAQMGATVRDSLQTSLRVIDRQIASARVALAAFPLALGVGVVAAFVRWRHGDLPPLGFVLALAAAFLFAAAITITVRRYRRGDLLPRRTELLEQLRALEEP
jgi:hypothetical protein